jgi:hypothetical protein
VADAGLIYAILCRYPLVENEVPVLVTVILGLILLVVLLGGGLIAALMWLVKSRYPKTQELDEPVLDTRLTESSKVDTCASCGKRRIIVRLDDNLCAFCYSSMRTKKLP